MEPLQTEQHPKAMQCRGQQTLTDSSHAGTNDNHTPIVLPPLKLLDRSNLLALATTLLFDRALTAKKRRRHLSLVCTAFYVSELRPG
jgi:hypothetical protein